MACCYSCIHLMSGADGKRRCRSETNALKVSRALEDDCRRYVREPGSDDEVPSWYWGDVARKRNGGTEAEVGVASQI